MKLNLLSLYSLVLVISVAWSAMVTDYIVTTNVAGAIMTVTSIYDPATRVAGAAAGAAAGAVAGAADEDDATTTKATKKAKTTAAAAGKVIKTLNPVVVTSIQTAADGSLQNVINTVTPVVSQLITKNAAGKSVTVTTTVTPGANTATDPTNVDPAAADNAGVTTLDPVVSTFVQTAADGSLQTVITTYHPYVSQVLSTNPAGVVVTVTATITPGVTGTNTAATTIPTDATMTTTTVTSTIAKGKVTTYTTVIPITVKPTVTKYSNPRDRPDPSTSLTPQPASPVTTLSWQSIITIKQGDTTFTTSAAPIIVWVTLTTNGAVVTVSTTFIQRFSSQYATVALPSSGSVGLGSLTGKIGVVKTDFQSTMKYNNNAFNLQYSPIWSIFAFLLSWFL